jgi:hypothetical protein
VKTIFVVVQAARDYDEGDEIIAAYENRDDATKFLEEHDRLVVRRTEYLKEQQKFRRGWEIEHPKISENAYVWSAMLRDAVDPHMEKLMPEEHREYLAGGGFAPDRYWIDEVKLYSPGEVVT